MRKRWGSALSIATAVIVLTNMLLINVMASENAAFMDEIFIEQEGDSIPTGEFTEGLDPDYDEALSENEIVSEDSIGLTDSQDSVEVPDDVPVASDEDIIFEDNSIQKERNDESEIVINSENENTFDISGIQNNNCVSKNGVKEFSDIIDYDTGSQDQIYAEGYPTGRVKSIAIDGNLDLAYSVGCKVLSGSITAFTDDDDYDGDPVDVSDPGVEVSGLEDTSSIGYKNIKIKYGGKTVAVKIYIGLDPKDTPVSFQNAGFNSIMECVNMISKLNKENLSNVEICVNKNLIEPTAIVIPMLTSKKVENLSTVAISLDEGVMLTLRTPSIVSKDNLIIESRETGGLRSENPNETIIVQYKYNTTRRGHSDILYPLAHFFANVSSPGGISFFGASNIDMQLKSPGNTATETRIIDVSKFKSLGYYDIKIYGKMSEIGRVNGDVWLADPVASSATIKDMGISSHNKLILTGAYDSNGKIMLPNVVIESIGFEEEVRYEKIGSITVRIVDVYGNLMPIPSGTTIINRKKTNIDYTQKIKIENKNSSGLELVAYNEGKVVKAGASTIGVKDDKGNEAKYVRPQDAFNRMEKGVGYTITLSDDFSATSLKLPSVKLKHLNIIGVGDEEKRIITFEKTRALTANYDLKFENIAFNTGIDKKGKPNKLTINQKSGKLTFVDIFQTDGVSVKGNSKSSLYLESGTCAVRGDVTGFGNIYVDCYAIAGTKFSTDNLHIGENAGLYIYEDHTVKATNVIGSQGSYISLATATDYRKVFKPLEIGTVNSDSDYKIKLILSDHSGFLPDGTQILKSAKADISKFDISGITPNDGLEYVLWRKNPRDKSVLLRAKKLQMDGSSVGTYVTFAEAVSDIESMNYRDKEYNIRLLGDYNNNGAMKFPKAFTYDSIKLSGSGNTKLNFTGNIMATGNLEINGIVLEAVNRKNIPAKYSINGAKGCELNIISSKIEMCNSINAAKSNVMIKDTVLSMPAYKITTQIKASNLYLDNLSGILTSFSADYISVKNNTTLNLIEKKTCKVDEGYTEDNIGKLIITVCNISGEEIRLKHGTVIFTSFKGETFDGMVEITNYDNDGKRMRLVRDKNYKVKAVSN